MHTLARLGAALLTSHMGLSPSRPLVSQLPCGTSRVTTPPPLRVGHTLVGHPLVRPLLPQQRCLSNITLGAPCWGGGVTHAFFISVRTLRPIPVSNAAVKGIFDVIKL